MTFSGPIGGLIDFAIGGGWGSEAPKDGHSRVAVIRGTDIPKVAAGDFSTVPFRFESDKKIVNRALSPGDVVLETAGGSSANGQYTGRTLLITQEILDSLGPTICASFCKKIVLKKDLVNPSYFYFYMQDLYNSGRVASYDSQSTGISNFQYEAFVNNEILELPPKGIQLSIAVALQNLNRKINANSKISKTLEEIAQTIFKSWFIDFDPVKAKMAGEKLLGMDDETASLFSDSMVETELGVVPNGWEISTVERFCPFVYGKSLPARVRVAGPFPVYGSNGIVGNHNAPLISRPTVVIGRKGTVGTVHLEMSPSWIIDTAFYTNSENDDDVFLAYLSLKRLGLDSMNSDAAVPGLNRDNAHRLPMTIATPLVREKFSQTVKPIFELNHHILVQNSVLSHVRDLLLPKLISGQLQIPEEMLAS